MSIRMAVESKSNCSYEHCRRCAAPGHTTAYVIHVQQQQQLETLKDRKHPPRQLIQQNW